MRRPARPGSGEGRLGGQNKVPRVIGDGALPASLLEHAGAASDAG
jgi:hypothetical protein